MATKNRKCLACSTAYRYCPSCSRADKLAPAWKAEFCSESCVTLWLTLTRYNMGTYTKTEAKSIVSSLDLKPIDTYVDCVKRDYSKVMAEEKKPKRGKRIEIKPVDEAIGLPKEVIESIVEELSEIKNEQPIEVAEPVEEETTVHGVVFTKENE